MIEISGGRMYLFDDTMQLLADMDAPIRLHHYGKVEISVDLTKQPDEIRRTVRHYQLAFPMPVLFGGGSTTVMLTSKVVPLEVRHG